MSKSVPNTKAKMIISLTGKTLTAYQLISAAYSTYTPAETLMCQYIHGWKH